MHASPATSSRKQRRTVAISSYLGTTLEFYDFLLYASAAALIFGPIFFANLSPIMGTIASFVTLAAGFVARVIGALVFGHFGDRIGRKRVVVTTMLLMGVTTGLIGLLPDYSAIGVAAPVLLLALRLIQGFAVGGEYGGAILMASEHSTTRRRGLMTSSAVMGPYSGTVLATVAMSLVTMLPSDALFSWGWRIPFLASFLLLGVAMWFRYRVEESPVFLAEKEKDSLELRRSSIRSLLSQHSGSVTKGFFMQLSGYLGQGIYFAFVVSYAPTVGHAPSVALLGMTAGSALAVFTVPFYGWLSDRIGRRRVVAFGIVAGALFAYPSFAMINSGSTAALVSAIIINAGLLQVAITSVSPTMLAEMFDTKVRFTGVSVTYSLAQAVGQGFAPLVAASLLAAAGGGTNTGLIVVLMVVVSVASLIALRFMPRNAGASLTEAGKREVSADVQGA